MTIIANLLVCALVLMALAALWILSRVFISWVKVWIASNQSDDCPPVMPSRHSKESHEMLERHLKKANLSPDDKQDIIAAERARRKFSSQSEEIEFDPDDGWYD